MRRHNSAVAKPGAHRRAPVRAVRVADPRGLDWPGYLCSLDEEGGRALAIWLAAEGLQVGEFMEVVDRAYAAAPTAWQSQSRPFITEMGRPTAEAYARCKHRFAGLVAALEEALLSGAMAGDVSPQELRPLPTPPMHTRPVALVSATLERARRRQT